MEKLIVANWKSNPASIKKAQKLALAEDYNGVVIAPPFPYLDAVGALLKNASLAAQDVFWKDGGAYTGEVSVSQLRDLGVKYVIVGHSERRALGETDDIVSKKVEAVLGANMQVIICVGEHLETRKHGIEEAKKFIIRQLKIGLKGVQKKNSRDVAVVYEPIWAISTNPSSVPDIPEESAELIAYIKNAVNIPRVFYGGSVNAKNAHEFLNQNDIDGVLVGGASLKPNEFKGIIDSA